MRSVPAGSFERLSAPEALWRAWTRSREGRRRRPDIASWDLDAERHVLHLSRSLREGSWRPGVPRLLTVFDPKPRCVVVAPIADRVLHQSMVSELGPWYSCRFIDQSYGCLPGRGPSQALMRLHRFFREHNWCLSLDVRSFFPSIARDTLHALWAHRLKDPATLSLLRDCADVASAVYARPAVRSLLRLAPTPEAGRGLIVGSYLSHFSAALYLDELDHFIKRELHIPGYVRYMDDLVLLATSRDQLLEARSRVSHWLLVERGLLLKDPLARPQSTAVGLTWLGHRVTRQGVTPTKKLFRNLRPALLRAAQRGPMALERLLMSYRGLVGAGLARPCPESAG